MATPRIDALIARFSHELSQLAQRLALQDVLAALQKESGAARRAPRTPVAKARRGRRSASDRAGLGERLLAHVRSNPGQRGEQIAAALRTDTTTMRPAMHKLIADRRVRTEGERRGMTYFPVAGNDKGGGNNGGGGNAAKRGRARRRRAGARGPKKSPRAGRARRVRGGRPKRRKAARRGTRSAASRKAKRAAAQRTSAAAIRKAEPRAEPKAGTGVSASTTPTPQSAPATRTLNAGA